MNTLISVIVPVYKVENYLNRCIDSILNQTYRNLEVILVDDGSPDNCPSICEEYAKKDSRIKIVHQENGGLSSARNTGLTVTSGEFITFVDSDDWIANDMYQILYNTMISQNADIVECNYFAVNEKTSEKSVPSKENIIYYDDDGLKALFLDKNIKSYVWNKLYKRNTIGDTTFPVGRSYEDTYTTYKFFSKAKKIVSINQPLYFYNIRSGSISRNFSPDLFLGIFQQYTDYSSYSKDFNELLQARVIRRGIVTTMEYIKGKERKNARQILKKVKTVRKLFLKNPYLSSKEKLIASLYFVLTTFL